MCYHPTVVVGSGKSKGHVWNSILAGEKQEAELILGKPQPWRGPWATAHVLSQECCGLGLLPQGAGAGGSQAVSSESGVLWFNCAATLML